jgi:hypothetical protein
MGYCGSVIQKTSGRLEKIGHVPKSMTNKIWDEFRDACNAFFNNYREKSNTSTITGKKITRIKKHF